MQFLDVAFHSLSPHLSDKLIAAKEHVSDECLAVHCFDVYTV